MGPGGRGQRTSSIAADTEKAIVHESTTTTKTTKKTKCTRVSTAQAVFSRVSLLACRPVRSVTRASTEIAGIEFSRVCARLSSLQHSFQKSTIREFRLDSILSYFPRSEIRLNLWN